MPMRRRAARNSRPLSRARSWPRNKISPAVGSTSRLMQRTSVDFPVPDGPMIAVMPRPSTLSDTSLSTFLMMRERSTSAAAGLNCVEASMELLLRLSRAQLLLGQLCGLALRFLVVSGFVVGCTGLLGDLTHHPPIVLVADRDEAIAAVELLGQFWCEAEGEEAIADSLGQFRVQVVGMG